ncbi:Hint domain-containing protein [Litoreibacter roseus]|uniref:Hedgehog/Intein (Hint) domain-containing protein n=1 Tax=Litoreibacter roseus TaxID=2601869 RepID=A0A6N6JLH8_9RHOB|nr:Hint domain-containing protein [Litoreibacter roseus]GFE66730.1 hypothetical protein KIN_38040 [Litoreibacter roseus]
MSVSSKSFTSSAHAALATHEPLAGLLPGTSVLTLAGPRRVEELTDGTRMITRKGTRTLLSITSTVRSVRAIRVARETLGDEIPTSDCLMMPEQRVLLRGWRAELFFGQDQVVTPISRLVDELRISQDTELSEVRAYTLQFETAEVIYADGMEVVCADSKTQRMATSKAA